MGRPYALSRWADHPKGADDNTDFTLLTLEVFKLRAMEAITLEGEEAIFMEWIWQSTQFDDPVVKALKALDAGELCSDEWTHWKQDKVIEHPDMIRNEAQPGWH